MGGLVLFFVKNIVMILVIIDGVRIGNRIYWTLTSSNYM
jgi:hypothetical protein